MSKKIKIISIIFLSLLIFTNVSLGFNVDMNLDKTKNIKINDEILLTINLSEKISGASFKLDYDRGILKLVGSQTANLSVAENNEKIACVYFDMSKAGTDILQIKFKIINNNKENVNFSIEESKFVTLDNETTYTRRKHFWNI